VLKIALAYVPAHPHRHQRRPGGWGEGIRHRQPLRLDWTLTTGIVSALNRTLQDEQGGAIEHLIQTDAAINRAIPAARCSIPLGG
jgi:S1-C subfamily serine protease